MDNAGMTEMIVGLVASYRRRRGVETTWRDPLVGFASAEDPRFDQFKEIIQSTHTTPLEILPGAKSVVAYFVPFSHKLHKENHEAGVYCSRSWAVAYVETNRLIFNINEYIRTTLESKGHRVALIPPTHNFDQETLMSDWSHRHVAYTAGIGRLGHHNLIITEKGCTGRLGSLVTDLDLEPSPVSLEEFCLQKAGIDCLKCVDRCQYDALFADRYDRHACYRQCMVNDEYHRALDLTDVCGKCCAMVPCSVTNPVRRRNRRRRSL